MPLRLANWIIWDFWLAPRMAPANSFHIFFLQAPRSIPDPEDRHNLATIGHAVSSDLRDWKYLGTALEPGPPGAWDDYTTWTGSTIRDGSLWWTFYTGRNRAESGRIQRIGAATSPDLGEWTRLESELLVADQRWYHTWNHEGDFPEDCRDPWVIRHDGEWLMYFTASSTTEPRDSRGVVGLARSPDLRRWEHLGPLQTPRQFGEIEVPQVLTLGGKWILLFCTAQHSDMQQSLGTSWNGSHYLVGDSPMGPFQLTMSQPLLADGSGTLYAARIIADPWLPAPVILAWRKWDEAGNFAGDLIDPIPLLIGPRGELSLAH